MIRIILDQYRQGEGILDAEERSEMLMGRKRKEGNPQSSPKPKPTPKLAKEVAGPKCPETDELGDVRSYFERYF